MKRWGLSVGPWPAPLMVETEGEVEGKLRGEEAWETMAAVEGAGSPIVRLEGKELLLAKSCG